MSHRYRLQTGSTRALPLQYIQSFFLAVHKADDETGDFLGMLGGNEMSRSIDHVKLGAIDNLADGFHQVNPKSVGGSGIIEPPNDDRRRFQPPGPDQC